MPKKIKEPSTTLNMAVPSELIAKLECVREITGLGSYPDAARYLMARGAEAMAAQIKAVEAVKDMADRFTPQELLPLIEQAEEAQNKL